MKETGMFEQDLWILPNINIDSVRTFPLHYHKHIEFLLILDGEAKMEISGTVYDIRKGDIVFITPYILHSYICHGSCTRCVVVFEPETFGFLGDYLIKNHPVTPVLPASEVSKILPDIEKTLEDSYTLCITEPHHDPKKMLRIISLLYGIFSELCNTMPFEGSDTMYDNIYISALKLCCDNFTDEEFGLEYMTRELCVSASTLQKLFAKNMKRGVKEYINYLRVGNAQSLLVSTKLPISEIAMSCGFGTIRSFNRAFLKFRGCTPGKVRQVTKQL